MTSTCAFVSFRLGLNDGISVAAAAWQRCLECWGRQTVRVAEILARGVKDLVRTAGFSP